MTNCTQIRIKNHDCRLPFYEQICYNCQTIVNEHEPQVIHMFVMSYSDTRKRAEGDKK